MSGTSAVHAADAPDASRAADVRHAAKDPRRSHDPMLSATAALPATADEPPTPALPITPEAPATPAEPTTPAEPKFPRRRSRRSSLPLPMYRRPQPSARRASPPSRHRSGASRHRTHRARLDDLRLVVAFACIRQRRASGRAYCFARQAKARRPNGRLLLVPRRRSFRTQAGMDYGCVWPAGVERSNHRLEWRGKWRGRGGNTSWFRSKTPAT